MKQKKKYVRTLQKKRVNEPETMNRQNRMKHNLTGRNKHKIEIYFFFKNKPETKKVSEREEEIKTKSREREELI